MKSVTCAHPSCDEPARDGNLGQYCNAHRLRNQRGKDMNAPLRKVAPRGSTGQPCIWTNCTTPSYARNLCVKHYSQKRRHGRVAVTRSERNAYLDRKCSITDCIAPAFSAWMCRNHAARARSFRLTPLQLDRILMDACAICGNSENLHIDHDHSCCQNTPTCGECTRGVLCAGCNHGLGMFGDDPSRLRAAIQYLGQ